MKIGLRLKSIIGMTLLVVCSASALSFYFIQHQQGVIHESLKQRGLTLASSLAYNAEYGVLAANPQLLHNLIAGVMQQPEVAYCIVQDNNGVVLAAKGLKQELIAFPEFNRIFKLGTSANKPIVNYFRMGKGRSYYDFTVPVTSEDINLPSDESALFEEDSNAFSIDNDDNFKIPITEKRIGVVRVGLSLSAVEKIESEVKQVAVVITVFIILISWLITIIFTGITIAPINKLVEGTKRIAKGDLKFKVNVKSKDEIGELAESFNKMTGDLERSHNELLKAKDYIDNIFKSLVDILVVVDPNGFIRTVNPATLKLLGYQEDEIVGQNVDIIFKEDPTKSNPAREITKELIKTGYISNYEMKCQTKDGKTLPVLFSGSVMKNEEGEVEGIVGIAKNIQERKVAQSLLELKNKMFEKVNKDLIENEYRLKASIADLEKTHMELEQTQAQLLQDEKLKVVGRLASGVAHEVKNPLAIILWGVEYLMKKFPKKDKNIETILNDINTAVHKADNVIKGVLDFSSITNLELKPTEINEVIEVSLNLLKYEVDQSHTQIIKDFSKGMPKISLDKNKIEQVLINIILNSIQAMGKDGKILVKTYLRKVTVDDMETGRRKEDLFKVGDNVQFIEIEDNGPGISEKIMQKIFDPFFSTKIGKGGTGLGLSIIRSIVELHTGKITLENRKEGGVRSTIMFKL